MALTRERARECIAVPLVDDGRIVGALGVSGAVPADHDHTIADTAAGHPVLPDGHR